MLRHEKPMISPAFDFGMYNIHLSTEMVRPVSAPNLGTSFGLKGSYEFVINEQWSIQAGVGRYYYILSLDDYDKYKNQWHNLAFGALHWDKWFIEYDYMRGEGIISIGVRELLANIK